MPVAQKPRTPNSWSQMEKRRSNQRRCLSRRIEEIPLLVRPADRDERKSPPGSESAPVPVARHTGSDIGRLAEIGRGVQGARLAVAVVGSNDLLGATLLRIDGILDLAQTVGARLFPAPVGAPAEIAGPRWNALGVKAGLLIKRDEVGGVRGAEDVAAMTTMVAAQKEAKGGTASGRITVGGGRVRLHEDVSMVLHTSLAMGKRKRSDGPVEASTPF